TGYWLGAEQIRSNIFKWVSSGQPIAFYDWDAGEPDEDTLEEAIFLACYFNYHPLQYASWKRKLVDQEIRGIKDVGISFNLTSGGRVTYSIGLHQTDVPFKSCSTVRGTPGECRYLAFCVLDVFLSSFREVLTYADACANEVEKTVLKVRLGEYDFTKESVSRKEYAVSAVYTPKGYRQDSYKDDIGIVTLATAVDFDCSIWRICLPRNGFSHFGKNATIIGWGETSTGITSNVLLQANVPVLTPSQCNAMIRSTPYDEDRMLCAAAEGQNSCNGDSGGPLMIKEGDKWHIFGIVSGGTDKECGTGRPAIYTRVDHYYDWIENILLHES
ncbi:unnamed protein product, partial [Cyprideis torosa]